MHAPNEQSIAVVIPCYKVARHIEAVIASVPAWVSHIIVVDDACPEGSGSIAQALGSEGLVVIKHEINQGVGGAMATGYLKALDLGADIIVKIDGDGQMDTTHMPALIEPLRAGQADYAKGNRFMDFTKLRAMPTVRLLGNSVLSFLTKAASGYWDIVDPTNGYTAITASSLKKLTLSTLSKRYFFESDLLIHLNIINAIVRDIPIPAQYGNENSSLSPWASIFQFPPRLAARMAKRIVLKYFLYDFNMASVYMLLGLPMFIFSLSFGCWMWADSIISHTPKSAGTIMVVALPLIVSFQMLLQAVQIDIQSVPRPRTHR